MCSFHLSGVRTGYLLGSLKGHKMGSSEAAGRVVGMIDTDDDTTIDVMQKEMEATFKVHSQIMNCYSSISVANIKESFMAKIKSSNMEGLDYDIVMAEILDELMGRCAYGE